MSSRDGLGSPDGSFDTSVQCVILSWPVINPLGRCRHGKRAERQTPAPEWPKSIIARHDSCWRSEANMAEGSPTVALESAEKSRCGDMVGFAGRHRTV